jgi:hypothetical protein
MGDVIAFTTSHDAGIDLDRFQPIRVARLTLVDGLWLVFGKVSISNFDGDPQDAHVWLRLAGNDVDETAVRIAARSDADSQSVSVQASVEVEEDRVPMDIVCATFDGSARMARLAAIKLDQLNPDL